MHSSMRHWDPSCGDLNSRAVAIALLSTLDANSTLQPFRQRIELTLAIFAASRATNGRWLFLGV
jgi:hypothetical protein